MQPMSGGAFFLEEGFHEFETKRNQRSLEWCSKQNCEAFCGIRPG